MTPSWPCTMHEHMPLYLLFLYVRGLDESWFLPVCNNAALCRPCLVADAHGDLHLRWASLQSSVLPAMKMSTEAICCTELQAAHLTAKLTGLSD